MAVIGIDLGTTNSLVVAYQNGKEVIIPNGMNEYLTPSVVSIDENEEVIVGKLAKERLISHPQQTTSLFKRKMGSTQTIHLKGIDYTPEELSAMVVKQLVVDAEQYLHEKVDEIVISVPAYFDSKQRFATKKIGEILGIKVERLINEPSAASIVCHKSDEYETFIIFDFGGGTLDVSIVDCFENVINVCSIAGDNQLGGSDFDQAIVLDFCKEHNLDFKALETYKQESLIRIAEQTKLALQKNETVPMVVILDKEYKSIYTNQRLREISNDIFSKMKLIIGKAVRDSGFQSDELDSLILVGGSSYMPVVQKFLKELLNIPVIYPEEVDTLVAMGLGKYIGVKQREDNIKDLVITDVCPFSLSLQSLNESDITRPYASVIIPKNTTLPCSESSFFTTSRLGQTTIGLHVYQGESLYAQDNLLIGQAQIEVPENTESNEGIIVTYTYDINSILFVEVKVLSTNEKHVFEVKENAMLKPTQETQKLDAIKEISLKYHREPDLELLRGRVQRIAREMDVYAMERFKEFIEKMEETLAETSKSPRKTKDKINEYNAMLDYYEKELNVDDLDVFQKEEDAKGWMS